MNSLAGPWFICTGSGHHIACWAEGISNYLSARTIRCSLRSAGIFFNRVTPHPLSGGLPRSGTMPKLVLLRQRE